MRLPSGEIAAVKSRPALASGPRSTLSHISGRSIGRVARHNDTPKTAATKTAAAAIMAQGPRITITVWVSAAVSGCCSMIRASPMACKRCRRSFCKHCRSSLRTAAGVSGGSAFQSGSNFSTEASVSETDSPLKASLPVSISYSTTPNDQMSARRSASRPCACSEVTGPTENTQVVEFRISQKFQKA
jgi:hypothetical protein